MGRYRDIPGEFKPRSEFSSVYSGLVGVGGGAQWGDGKNM